MIDEQRKDLVKYLATKEALHRHNVYMRAARETATMVDTLTGNQGSELIASIIRYRKGTLWYFDADEIPNSIWHIFERWRPGKWPPKIKRFFARFATQYTLWQLRLQTQGIERYFLLRPSYTHEWRTGPIQLVSYLEILGGRMSGGSEAPWSGMLEKTSWYRWYADALDNLWKSEPVQRLYDQLLWHRKQQKIIRRNKINTFNQKRVACTL